VGTSIRNAVALAAGATVVAAKRQATAQSANERVVLGLIGAGGRGRYLLNRFLAMENVQAKYVCDVEDARGQADDIPGLVDQRLNGCVLPYIFYPDKDGGLTLYEKLSASQFKVLQIPEVT